MNSVLAQVVTPQPPLPPPIPGVPEEVAIITVIAIIALGVLLLPLVRALARRLEGKIDSHLRAEIDALHQRVAELEAVENRLAELENRMEFSERLLTQQRESEPRERA